MLKLIVRILLLLIPLSLAGVLWFWFNVGATIPDQSFLTLFNKLSAKAGLTTNNAALIKPGEQYSDRFQKRAVESPYPRILMTELQGWDGLSPAHAFSERLAGLKRNQENTPVDCNSAQLEQLIFCSLLSPSRVTTDQIETALVNFRVVAPKATGRYGNSWWLALSYDLARANPNFSADAIKQIDDLMRTALLDHLSLLDGGNASLWHGRSTIAASAFLLASVLDLNFPTNKRLYSRAYGHFNDVITAISATETWPEGYNYWLQERGMPIALALASFKNSSKDVAQRQQLDRLMRRVGLWHIYLTRPDNRIEGWGDEGSRSDLKEGTRRTIDILAQASREPLLARYSHYLKNLHPNASYYRGRRWQTLIFNDPSVSVSTAKTVKTLKDVMGVQPTAALFGPGYSNHLVIRAGWGPEDTFITYRASDIFTHHQHYDAGHFTLFKGNALAVNSSTYGAFLSPHRLNYAIRTIAKNSLLIVDPNEKVIPNHLFKKNVADGGQRLVIPTGSAIRSFDHWLQSRYAGTHYGTSELLAYASEPGIATYIETDITRAYNSTRYAASGNKGKVKRVTRALLYLYAEDSLIVRDQVITTDPSYQARWVLHTYEKFESSNHAVIKGQLNDGVLQTPLDNKGLTTRHQAGVLRMTVLQPSVDQITQIGGKNHKYYIEAGSEGVTSIVDNYVEGSSDQPWFEQPLWRTEIRYPYETTTQDFMVVLQPDILSNASANINNNTKDARPVPKPLVNGAIEFPSAIIHFEQVCDPAKKTNQGKTIIRIKKQTCGNSLSIEQPIPTT